MLCRPRATKSPGAILDGDSRPRQGLGPGWAEERRPWPAHLFYGPDGFGERRRAETLAKALYAGVGLEGAARGFGLLLRGALLSLGRRLGLRRDGSELQPYGLAVIAGERLRELLLDRRGSHEFAAGIERQSYDGTLAAHENTVRRELTRGALQLERADHGGPVR